MFEIVKQVSSLEKEGVRKRASRSTFMFSIFTPEVMLVLILAGILFAAFSIFASLRVLVKAIGKKRHLREYLLEYGPDKEYAADKQEEFEDRFADVYDTTDGWRKWVSTEIAGGIWLCARKTPEGKIITEVSCDWMMTCWRYLPFMITSKPG